MRLTSLLMLGALNYGPLALAQNSSPDVKVTSVVADTIAKQVVITYSLSDKEKDKVRVTFKVSSNKGQSYLVNTANATGDIGYPVSPGKQKKIVWRYPRFVHNINQYQIKLIADDLRKVDIGALVKQVDTVALASDLGYLYGIRNRKSAAGEQRLKQVRDTLERAFRQAGLLASRQEFRQGDYSAYNIVGKIRGNGDEVKTYVLCAHYDTVEDSPGADDNASGVLGMLSVMRVLSQYNFRHSINFVALDLEEEGLFGSKAYVEREISDYERVAGAVNFDMIGCYSEKPNTQTFPEGFDQLFPEVYRMVSADKFRANFAVSIANEASGNLSAKFDSCAAAYVPALKVASLVVPGNGHDLPTVRRGDHASFWDNDLNALFLGDGADTRNHNYHSPNDTVETISLKHIRNVTAATLAMIAELAGINHATVVQAPIATNAPQLSKIK